ncbi:Cyclin/Brf1-like TBP-binding protein, putative isoform 1 [Hibiscus syriacus]|uniref:Cyclin/Brf1-like TBP-binding protein, putative isoform 1 n=1 Tax=Hibiscus syriacus TaxID=106335 RepID=A0A6A3B9N2_HIBSY|nr:Cyclin/Brf1-like TBP-binding protein, putative isoform 1 [Hibiscus syriacus]
MDQNKGGVSLMLIFLGFSYLLNSCAAFPTTRCLMLNKELLPSSSVEDLHVQDVMKMSESEQVLGEGERKLLESTDYPGPGANKNHDPKNPGT